MSKHIPHKFGINGSTTRQRTTFLRRPQRKALKISYRQQALNLRTQEKGKKLTYLDNRIIKLLFACGILTRRQIQDILNWQVNPITASAKLRELYRRHVINIATDVSHALDENGLEVCHAYTLDKAGQWIIALDHHVTPSDVAYGKRYVAGSGEQSIMHDLMTNELYARVSRTIYEQERRALTQEPYASDPHYQTPAGRKQALQEVQQSHDAAFWTGELSAAIFSSTGDELVRPDGLLTLILRDRATPERKNFFVELDRGSTPWPEKVNKYQNAKAFGQWQDKTMMTFPAVLCVFTNVRVMQRAAHTIRLANPKQPFLLCYWPTLLQSNPLTGWHLPHHVCHPNWEPTQTKQTVALDGEIPVSALEDVVQLHQT